MGIDINYYYINGPMPRSIEVFNSLIMITTRVGKWQFHCHHLNLSRDEVCEGVAKMQKGWPVQDAFPTSNADQREKFITDPDMWVFEDEEETNDDE